MAFLGSFFDSVFGWSVMMDPLFGIVFIAFILTFLITLAYKYFTDQDLLKSVRERSKALQKELKGLRDQPDKFKKKQSEVMELQMKLLPQTLKPMIITFIPIIIVFNWLRVTYEPIGPVLFGLGWIWAYIIFSIVFSFALRKLLKVH